MQLDRRTMLLTGSAVALGACVSEPLSSGGNVWLSLADACRDAPDPDEVVELWPGLPPGGEGVTVEEEIVARDAPEGMRDRYWAKVRTPSLTVFRPVQPNGIAVIIAPGGAYQRVVIDKEGFETARWLASRGYTCFVLKYRLPGDGWTPRGMAPLQDAQRAIRLVKFHRERWGVNRVVMMGFSAGGHVAGSAITRFKEPVYAPVDEADAKSARPDIGCLVYPVHAMTGPFAHRASAQQLLGDKPSSADMRRAEFCNSNTIETPPTILFHSRDDTSVLPGNSQEVFGRLRGLAVPSELHLFPDGGHGYGLRGTAGKACGAWPSLLLKWVEKWA